MVSTFPCYGKVLGSNPNYKFYVSSLPGCSSVWLERVVWADEAAGSSPVIRTIKDLYMENHDFLPPFRCHG